MQISSRFNRRFVPTGVLCEEEAESAAAAGRGFAAQEGAQSVQRRLRRR